MGSLMRIPLGVLTDRLGGRRVFTALLAFTLVDVGMDDLTPVTRDYAVYDNEFAGTIRKIVVGVGPMGEAFDPPLEWNGVG